jgi:hypothetical protein
VFGSSSVTCAYRSVATYESWLRHLTDIEFARTRHMITAAEGVIPGPDYVGVILLPSLLYVRTVSILDEALEEYVDDRELSMPRKYRRSLGGRIEFLDSLGLLHTPQDLRDVKDRRNEIAHDSNKAASYEDLAQAVDIVEATLQHLNFVGPRPHVAAHAECTSRATPNPGALITHDYTYGVKLTGITSLTINGQSVSEIAVDQHWSVDRYLPSSGPTIDSSQ